MSNSNETNNDDSNNINTKRVVLVISLIILAVVGIYFFNFHYRVSEKNEVWGAFGDYFGGILNPVIAAFAFYLIAKTYELQKRELEETRKLLKISTDAQNNQVKLAALTALLNSNITRITLLESEKLSLLESEFRHPQPKEYKDINTTITSVLDGTYGEYIKTRKDYVNDEVNVLKTKNIKLEPQIEAFMKE